MKTYEVYAVVRVSGDSLDSASLDAIQDTIRRSLECSGWPADDVWVEEAVENEEG